MSQHKKRNSLDNPNAGKMNFQIAPQAFGSGQTSGKLRQISYSPYHGQTKLQA